ncbi:hypothetical protein [Marinifilum caeruleilacunae]|jgi:hypothetical protein|uniref:TonB C-terminal domain-containing protein n=1 Tax=Marinifilum caeruleilacunae TaxID=2499076 RepID=A0ABX1WVA1_9BACT|nr:hypothetical protein [Marinifilum caeruleilacunae]NOU59962.1 hypothetical protein [Marinifilum caeruleilacunae]
MKNIKSIVLVLACLLSINVTMAITPETKKIEKEKSAVLKKIQKLASQTSFTDYVRKGESELIVLRCTVNENNEVVVSKVIGFDEELKKAVRKTMESKKIRTTAALSGEELALRLKFATYEK